MTVIFPEPSLTLGGNPEMLTHLGPPEKTKSTRCRKYLQKSAREGRKVGLLGAREGVYAYTLLVEEVVPLEAAAEAVEGLTGLPDPEPHRVKCLCHLSGRQRRRRAVLGERRGEKAAFGGREKKSILV